VDSYQRNVQFLGNLGLPVEQHLLIRILSYLVILCSIGSIFLLIGLAFIRLTYPHELEWIEGAHLDQIRWILDGGGLYGEPSISFIPFAYNPIYFMISAGLMKLLGIGFLAPRLLSILATMGSIILIAIMVKTERGNLFAGIIASGIYAATFRFTGAWMDLVKTDSLFLFLILAGFILGLRNRKPINLVASGILLVLAYYTKQLALPVILVMAAFSLFSSVGKSWPQWFTVGFTGIVTFFIIETITDNWFSFYTLDNYLRHSRVLDPLIFWEPIIKKMWPTMLIGTLYPICKISSGKIAALKQNEHFWGYLGLGIGLIVASWTVFTKQWTYDNGFMPAALGLAIFAGLGIGEVTKQIQKDSNFRNSFLLKVGLLSLIVIQFAILAYNPLQQLPSQTDRVAREDFIQQIGNLPGEILVFHHGYVNFLAGKNSYIHSVTYGDIIGGAQPPKSGSDLLRLQMVEETFSHAITNQTFEWIVVGEPAEQWLPYYLDIGEEKVIFFPATGAPAQPEVILRRNPFAGGGEIPLTDTAFQSIFDEGWGGPQESGRSILGEEASIKIALDNSNSYLLQLEAYPLCKNAQNVRSIAVIWNDETLERTNFSYCETKLFSVNLHSSSILPTLNTLSLVIEYAEETSTADDREFIQESVRITSIFIKARDYVYAHKEVVASSSHFPLLSCIE
jgi:hypothetical protein